MKKKMIQYNLLKNSIAAYFAMIEIHNKPNMSYRYETVTLLIVNAWELALKSFMRKYIKNRSIYTEDGHTISLDKALSYVNEKINSEYPKKFIAVKENIELIEEYRNNITHFYNEELEPYIFMLVAKSALNYVEFIKEYFNKDIMNDEGLFILPLGFKLPFKPEEFLSTKAASRLESEESKKYMRSIVKKIEDLKEDGVEDSIVLGFSLYMESIKKCSNSDLIAAITDINDADIKLNQKKKVEIVNDKNAIKVGISDEELVKEYPLTYKEIWKICKEKIDGFKKNAEFDSIMKELKKDAKFAYERKANPNSEKTSKTYLYSESIVNEIEKKYESK